jgi:ATP-binding cassette, subfamily F, member 3
MVLLQLDHISRSFGAVDVLTDATLQVQDNSRIGLIGPNGSGKTTLARIMAGDIPPSTGSVSRTHSLSLGYLRQVPQLDGEKSVHVTMLEADMELVEMGREIADLEARIATGEASTDELERYGHLRDQFDHRGGYDYESRCETILGRLGFPQEMYTQSVGSLSGGQQSRLDLALLLLRRPDILLLDEPTNHLDIRATEWLEGFLSTYPGAVVVISHDRVFLDRVVTSIVEVEGGVLEGYPGNYTAYIALKTQRDAERLRAYEEQQEFIKKTEDFIRRNIANVKKTRAAQTRRRNLEKLVRLTPPRHRKPVNLRFNASNRGGNDVVEVRSLSKSYDGLRLFDNLSFMLRRGERVGIVGPNGSGKSTLLRLIVGEEEPDTGTVRYGVGVESGYFDQRMRDLDRTKTVIDEVWSVEPGLLTEQIRTYLGNFLFSEDEQFRDIAILSGGEQNRVALAKLVLSRKNLLILDEPTNHLDIPARLVLEGALDKFDGTLLVVSHDRAFLRRVTSRIMVIENGKAILHEYGYTGLEERAGADNGTSTATSDVPDEKAARIARYGERKEQDRIRRQRERRIAETEGTIATAEKRIEDIDAELSDPAKASEWSHLEDLSRERTETLGELDRLYEKWNELEASADE